MKKFNHLCPKSFFKFMLASTFNCVVPQTGKPSSAFLGVNQTAPYSKTHKLIGWISQVESQQNFSSGLGQSFGLRVWSPSRMASRAKPTIKIFENNPVSIFQEQNLKWTSVTPFAWESLFQANKNNTSFHRVLIWLKSERMRMNENSPQTGSYNAFSTILNQCWPLAYGNS